MSIIVIVWLHLGRLTHHSLIQYQGKNIGLQLMLKQSIHLSMVGQLGDQRKKIQEKGEPNNPYKLGRKYGKTKCSKCHQLGHNSRGCKNPIMESVKESCKRSRKRNYEVQSSQVVLDPPPQSQSSQVQ